MKKILKKLILALASVVLFIPSVSADFLPVQVYATDTVAGYPSALRTSLVDPYQDVRFVMEKPDGGVVQIPAQADVEGVARTDFYGHQTKIAGTYKAALVFPGSDKASPQSTFTVYPDELSTTQSTLRSTLQMAEAGTDVSFMVATLYDQYRNPLSDHLIELISSRPEDEAEALQGGITDQNGRANFRVRSVFPGVSVFTAMDVTMNKVLNDREEVVFFAPAAPGPGFFGADLLAADIGQGEVLPGPIDHFDIQGLPSTVKVQKELSMSVVARDSNNNVAKNYTGTILISVPEDDNAILPNNGEYTFKAADLGQFTFDLSLQFSQLGPQVVQVFDKNNFKIAGEHELDVVSGESVVPAPTSPDLVIKSPADGAEFGSNLVILTGQGFENINLKVFDNDVKIGDTETDTDGFFSFEAKNLDSGSHTFYMMSEAGDVSRAITLTIDTLPPVLNSFEIDAEGSVVPGTQVTITLTSEPRLEEAKLRIQGIEEPMTEKDPGTYEATVIAPAQDGQFPVDVILVDSLSNKSEFADKGTIVVSTPKPANPPQVIGLEGEVGDSLVTLAWNPVQDHERPIQHYRIYYGTQMNQMDQTVDTVDSTFTWELRDLENDRQYFIAVKAVDSQGLESEENSVTIAVTPVAPDLCANVDCGTYGQCTEGVCECEGGWSGLTCNVEPVAPVVTLTVGQIQATPYDSAVVLSWSPFAGVQAFYYQVFMGFAPGQYIDSVLTVDNRPTVTIADLINDMPYYFAVMALGANGQPLTPLSQEVLAMPSGTGFRPAAPSPIPFRIDEAGLRPGADLSGQLTRVPRTDRTGPEALWVILISVVFAYFLTHHKRKILNR